MGGVDGGSKHALVNLQPVKCADQWLSQVPNLTIVVVSLDEALWLLIHVDVVEQLGDPRVVLLGFGKDRFPELLVVPVKLNGKFDDACQVVAALVDQHLNRIFCIARLEVQISLFSIQTGVLALFSRFVWLIDVCRHQKAQQLGLVEFDVQVDLLLVVLPRHFFVDLEDLVQEQVHILLQMLSFFMRHLTNCFLEFLHARVDNLEGPVLAVPLQDVPHGLTSVDAKQLAEVLQREVKLVLLEEFEDPGVLFLQDYVEGMFVRISLLVQTEERIEQVLVVTCAFSLQIRLELLN